MVKRISTESASPFSLTAVVKGFLSREGVLVAALDRISFEAAPQGITCIVGPTGSGKSTILRILAGLEPADEGRALVAGSEPAGQSGRIGYLTQKNTLFPWMTVSRNMSLPLDLKQAPAGEREEQVNAICSQLGLAEAKDLYPYELSGGMQQRVALGRLLASAAPFWLMDEPFNALDERTRHRMQELLLGLVRERRLSVLFVTHSIDEAVFLASRVIVVSSRPGKVADSLDIALDHPRDRVSADFGQVIERIRCRIEAVLQADK